MSILDSFEKDNNVKQQSSNYPFIKRPNQTNDWTPISDQMSATFGDIVFATDTKESLTLLSSLALRFTLSRVKGKNSKDKNGLKFRMYKLEQVKIA